MISGLYGNCILPTWRIKIGNEFNNEIYQCRIKYAVWYVKGSLILDRMNIMIRGIINTAPIEYSIGTIRSSTMWA